MIHEIEQIKNAEQDAITRIEAAEKQADQMIRKAREEAAALLQGRREEAEKEVKKIRADSLAQAHQTSIEISGHADGTVTDIEQGGAERMHTAATYIVQRVIGGSDVLSRTDG